MEMKIRKGENYQKIYGLISDDKGRTRKREK